jgi:hypothetical protein
MRGLDVRIVAGHGQALGFGQGLLKGSREFVVTHGEGLLLRQDLGPAAGKFKIAVPAMSLIWLNPAAEAGHDQRTSPSWR